MDEFWSCFAYALVLLWVFFGDCFELLLCCIRFAIGLDLPGFCFACDSLMSIGSLALDSLFGFALDMLWTCFGFAVDLL